MFSSISVTPRKNSRRTATLCSAVVHVGALAALWAVSHAITAPPIPKYEPREALLVVPSPPRLFRPRAQPKTAVQRFETKPTSAARIPEAIRETPEAPKVEVRTDPAPVLPQREKVAVPSPAEKPTGFSAVARAAAPKPDLEPQAAAFGAALGRRDAAKAIPVGGSAAFGAVGLARKQSVTAVGEGGFGSVEVERAARRSSMGAEAGFGAAERGLATATERGPIAKNSSNRPMKILWKPVPQYSEEGINRRIEGDVVLLVRFLAQGAVETLKIISGLGYGLDEYALEAAQSIRFEPAIENDQAIDHTAQVRIRFELAY